MDIVWQTLPVGRGIFKSTSCNVSQTYMGLTEDFDKISTVILLDEELSQCIKPWQNFVKAHNPRGDSVYTIYHVLKKQYNAVFRGMYVQFATEDDVMMFLMTWS
jgi:hypothetical protein